ncbi:hypothetical protein D2E76_15910 [Mycobacteroides abscessus]|uniref:Uncharacterized protein n=1 Tax=Mycobacteroides abscessus TaxID=36809 RepID=A0ABD7HM33_9MYCO|nr:hypothetical protein [Mycobacteroides abscessus]RIT36745.1 hypothetical protein D2E76_15910 [Mycobacteroides abscessus]
MKRRDRRAKPPTEILASGFLLERPASLFDVAMAGIASATGNLDDPRAAWEAVNWLRSQGNYLPLPIWWAAATWPERVEQLVLPPSVGDKPKPGTEAALATASLAAAGLMETAEAQQLQHWPSALAGAAADKVAAEVAQGTMELLVRMNPERLNDMVMKIRSLNTEVRVGGSPPEFSENYLLGVAHLAEGLRFVSAGLLRALTLISDHLSADTAANSRPPSLLDIPADLRKKVSMEVHVGFVQASTKIALPEDL